MRKDKTTLDCYCPKCEQTTHHNILFSVDRTSDDQEFWWSSKYSIVKCMGCDNIQFHKEDWDETLVNYDEDGNEFIGSVSITFPDRERKVDEVSGFWSLPESIRNLYQETMACYNDEHFQLAASGFRAIIEAICRDAKVAGKNLESMINNLAKAHIITAKDRDHLHAIRFMGNDSIHSIRKYPEKELKIVAHVVNAILTSLYIISDEVRNLDVKPISKVDEFLEILDERIAHLQVGRIDTLRNLVKHERRIISEDIPKFESELQTMITSGTYTKLSMCPTPTQGRAQQYKIEFLS